MQNSYLLLSCVRFVKYVNASAATAYYSIGQIQHRLMPGRLMPGVKGAGLIKFFVFEFVSKDNLLLEGHFTYIYVINKLNEAIKLSEHRRAV